MKLHYASLLAILIGGISALDDDIKVWMHNTDFENPSNWDLKRVPCQMDRVIFPPDLYLEVALPGGRTALRELVLSPNGELLLPTNGVLDIGEAAAAQQTTPCAGEDIRFTRSGAKDWLDPANWQSLPGKQNDAVPHVERVPCQHDVVQFKEGASVKIQLPDVDLVVGKIRFGLHEMGHDEWLEWLESDVGFRQLVGRWDSRSTSLAVQPASSSRCAAQAGCACHAANARRILEQVCRFETPRCPTPRCYEPVSPRGHCCPICGALLHLEHDAAFDQEALQSLIDDYTEDGKYGGVEVHARKTALESDGVQIVIVERGTYQGVSGELATQMADDILKDMDLGVKKITVISAGPMILGSKLVSAVKTMFGTFFGVLLFMAAIFYVFVVYKKGLAFSAANYQLFQFARFENAPGEEDAVLAIGGDRAPSVTSDGNPSKSFDNPMYGATSASTTAGPEETVDLSVTLANPIYSELKKREEVAKEEGKEDETESDEDSDSDVESIVGKSEGETTFHEVSFEKGE